MRKNSSRLLVEFGTFPYRDGGTFAGAAAKVPLDEGVRMRLVDDELSLRPPSPFVTVPTSLVEGIATYLKLGPLEVQVLEAKP